MHDTPIQGLSDEPYDDWPPGWCGLVPGQGVAFLKQLAPELGPRHPLAPAIRAGQVRATGVAEVSDDVVYALAPGVMETPSAVVHLAWPPRDNRPRLLQRLFPRPAARWEPRVTLLAELSAPGTDQG